MTHPNRSRRRANALRRKLHAERCEPLPALEQLIRANERAHAHLKRYPHPPLYRLSYAYPKPVQPTCYDFQRV